LVDKRNCRRRNQRSLRYAHAAERPCRSGSRRMFRVGRMLTPKTVILGRATHADHAPKPLHNGGTQARVPLADAHATSGLANAVSCAQDEPKCLRQTCALLPSCGENAEGDSCLVPKHDNADGAKMCSGQSAQRSRGSPARGNHVRAGRAARRWPAFEVRDASGVTPCVLETSRRLGRRARNSASRRVLPRVSPPWLIWEARRAPRDIRAKLD